MSGLCSYQNLALDFPSGLGKTVRMSHEPASQAIIVLGMHRSATSAFTGLLNLLGVDLGTKLIAASADNQSGYWEHTEIVAIHDRLLAELGSRWDDTGRPPEGWWLRSEVGRYREQIKAILARDFGGSPLWALKDPRMCRLMPLWRMVMEEMGLAPVWVLLVRHPYENIGSLDKRDGFSWQKSELLWLRHNLEAEYFSRDARRVVVTFDQFLTGWADTMERLRAAIGTAWPVPPEIAAERAASYVDPGKRHHKVQRAADPGRLSAWSREAHAALLAGAGGGETEMREGMDAVRNAADIADGLFQPMLSERGGELEKQLAAESARFAEMSACLQEMRAKYAEAKEKLAVRKAELEEKKERLRSFEGSPGAKLNRLLGRTAPREARVEPVHLPEPGEAPETTVIVSMGRDVGRVARCVRALGDQIAGRKVEVMAVADAKMTAAVKDWKNLEAIEAGGAESFAEPRKRAAQKARGTYLIFLQDRVIPGAGWYEALIEPLRAHPEGGVVGTEAGRVRSGGEIEMLTPGDDGELREADFCTTACMALPKHLFFQVGGFDGFYLPVEEATFGLKIGRTKRKVWQQPGCRFTLEGQAERIDPKRFESNWQRFARRWPEIMKELEKS